MRPVYAIEVGENDDLGVDFNSFVDVPAHMKGFIAFGKDQKAVKYTFSEDKRIVTGVMIAANLPIYRGATEQLPEHDVVFPADTIEIIRNKFHKKGFNNNVNMMHDSNKVAEGVFMISSYIIGGDKNPSVPEVFKSQKLNDGTWIASYYIQNDKVWSDIKAGKFQGFSVEGWFDHVEMKFKTENRMSKKKTALAQFMKAFFGDEDVLTDFAKATTVDGVELSYEGELAIGTLVTMTSEDGEAVSAPEGDHQITLEDGSVKLIVLDAGGVVTSIEDGVIEDEEMASIDDVSQFISEYKKRVDAEFAAVRLEMKTEIDTLKVENDNLKKSLDNGKFAKAPLKNDGGKVAKTFKDYMKKN